MSLLSLVREDGHSALTPRYSIEAEPNKSKVPISCKLSPAVAGAERYGGEIGVGCRLCPAGGGREDRGGGGGSAERDYRGLRGSCWSVECGIR